jgi:hypothetical protein
VTSTGYKGIEELEEENQLLREIFDRIIQCLVHYKVMDFKKLLDCSIK